MAQEGFKRKLTAILIADAVGYSRLMGDDEEATIRTLTEYRDAITALVNQHKGRVVDSPGDNFLAEFASVVDAVRCAVETQKQIAERNADLSENRRMLFRIGVNLGDIVDEGERIYGDGVNIAARLEGLAEAGGICISRTAYDQVKNKLELGYEYLGEHSVKNIADPVHVYRVLIEPEAAGKVIGEKRFLGKLSRKIALTAIIVLVIVAGGLIGWNIYLQQSKKVEPASKEKMAFPLPDKPSIAVLPFDNLSGDPNQEFFSDGLTEEIISALSKAPRLFVIARNSSFTYKGKPVKIQKVSEELGVRYVLEGSVRKSGNQLRITTQLIDALTGHHLWSERYDRELKDIFAVQDDITTKILTAIRVQLTTGEQALLLEKCTKDLQAYLKILEGIQYSNIYKHAEAIERYEEALTLDPQNACAYGWLSWEHLMNVWFGSAATRGESLKKAFVFAEKCKALNDTLAACRQILGHAYLMKRDYDKAISEGKIAMELNPNSSLAAILYGWTLRSVGSYEDALEEYEKAQRLDPFNPVSPMYHKCATYNVMRRHEEAIATCEKVIELDPKYSPAYFQLALAYSVLNQMDKARTAASQILKIYPNFSVEAFAKAIPYKKEADRDLLIDGLRKAGLPE
jgi:adenylate cyclase